MTNNINNSAEPLLRIKHLKEYFNIPGKGELHAVDDISLDIMPYETLGLVGESGCGKSTVGNVIVRLLEATAGEIEYEGKNLLSLKGKDLMDIRREIQMIFQDPYSSLNPRKTVRQILAEPLKIHNLVEKDNIDAEVKKFANQAGLEDYVLDKYPHELDGGKRQMVGIARALALQPKFIVCDEPVSALDVSVQATILNLLMDLQKKLGLTYLFISHDLSVVRHISDKVAVMYLGQIVEYADTKEIFENTGHPYSIALLSAVPKLEFENKTSRIVLEGDVPSPLNPSETGCRFAPRCWMACEECKKITPQLEKVSDGHYVRCPYYEKSRRLAEEKIKEATEKRYGHQSS